MPDTGEDREIQRRVNAKEAVRVSQSQKLLQRTRQLDNAAPRMKRGRTRRINNVQPKGRRNVWLESLCPLFEPARLVADRTEFPPSILRIPDAVELANQH